MVQFVKGVLIAIGGFLVVGFMLFLLLLLNGCRSTQIMQATIPAPTCQVCYTCTPSPTPSATMTPTSTQTYVMYVTVCISQTVTPQWATPTQTPSPSLSPFPTPTVTPSEPSPSPTASVGKVACLACDPQPSGYAAVRWSSWRQISPAEGIIDRGFVDSLLDSSPHGVILQMHTSNSDQDWTSKTDYVDYTPAWVGVPSVVLTDGDARCILPDYRSSRWREAWGATVRALGAAYANDPRLMGFDICTGLDGETHIVKYGQGDWPDVLDVQAPGMQYRFSQWVYEAMDVARAAFPNKPVFIMSGAGGSGAYKAYADYAAEIGCGIKINAGLPDSEDHEGIGNYTGKWYGPATYSMTVPIWAESQHGIGDTQFKYWTVLALMHYHPFGVDFHPEYFVSELAEVIEWAHRRCGVTRDNTPSVWTVLRDREYEPKVWDNGNAGISGKNGDWTFWLYRTAGGVRVWARDLPVAQNHAASRQCRVTSDTHYMDFAIDTEFDLRRGGNGYRIAVTVLDYGTDRFSLQYRRVDGGVIERFVSKTNTGTWRVFEWDCADWRGTQFRLHDGLDGVEYIHRIEIWPR